MASSVAPSVARAQGGEGALAEALFRSARALIAAKKYAEACPKFAESQRIDPKLGTLLNLALCHEKEGKTASAWAEYTQAAELAARAGQANRERVARASATALESVLPHLILRATKADDVTVSLDGNALGSASLGTPIPVDPGPHQVTASAEHYQPFSTSVTIAPGRGEQTVDIPSLEPLPTPVIPPPVVTEDGAATSPKDDVARKHVAPVLGYSLLGGGAATVAVGAVFGVLAFSKKSAAEGECSVSMCTAVGSSDISSLKAFEAISTIAVGTGLAVAAAGVYFLIRPPSVAAVPPPPASSDAPTTKLSVRVEPLLSGGLTGLVVRGVF